MTIPCPDCGAPLDYDPACMVETPATATFDGLRTVRRPVVTVTTPALLCTGCEYCAKIVR